MNIIKLNLGYCEDKNNLYNPKYFFSKKNQVVDKFKQLIQDLKQNDFSHWLYAKQKIAQIINFINRNWAIYEFSLNQQMDKLLHLVSLKLGSVKYSDIFYSHLFLTLKQISKKVIHSDKNKILPFQDKINDIIFKAYIQEMETKPNRKIYFIKNKMDNQKILLSRFIAQSESLFFDQKWQQIYQKIHQQIQKFKNDEATLRKRRLQQNFSTNIKMERTPNIDCLGCTKFYYMNMNIYDHKINKCKIALEKSIRQLLERKFNVTQEICALLNGGGGILLFNCQRSYLNVIPKGQYLTQREKVKYMEDIYSFLKSIYPRPNITSNVQVTFVPVKEDPFENDHNGEIQTIINDNHFDDYYKRRYIKGLYVTRIKVMPTDGHTTYVLTKNGNQKKIPIRLRSIFDSQTSKIQIKGDQVEKFIHKRSSKKYQDEIKKAQFLRKKYSDFDHQCNQPDLGQPISKIYQMQKKSHNEKKFRFVSILDFSKENLQEVKLKLQKNNIICQIQIPYQDRNITTVIIYYNDSSICNFVTVTPITNYIRFFQRTISNNQLISLEQWVNIYHPTQTISICKDLKIKGPIQIYLYCESKSSSSLIFSLLRNSGYNPIFLDMQSQ